MVNTPNTVFSLVRYGGIYVRVKTDNSSQTLVTLAGYKAGYAPVLLVNSLPSWTIEYGDQASGNRKRLEPGEKVSECQTLSSPSPKPSMLYLASGSVHLGQALRCAESELASC